MKFAVVSDIHGNIDALESVLEDIGKRNIDFIVSTGDLVGYLPFPNEVVDCIRSNRILTIQGNHDKAVAEFMDSGASRHSNRVIRDDNREYLAALPKSLLIQSAEASFLLVHGSPRRIDEYMYEDMEVLEALAYEFDEDIVISGHTHKPYHLQLGEKQFINAGSVGKPRHGNPRSTYVMVEARHGHIKCNIIEVDYSLDRIKEAIAIEDSIDNKLIHMLESGV